MFIHLNDSLRGMISFWLQVLLYGLFYSLWSPVYALESTHAQEGWAWTWCSHLPSKNNYWLVKIHVESIHLWAPSQWKVRKLAFLVTRRDPRFTGTVLMSQWSCLGRVCVLVPGLLLFVLISMCVVSCGVCFCLSLSQNISTVLYGYTSMCALRQCKSLIIASKWVGFCCVQRCMNYGIKRKS